MEGRLVDFLAIAFTKTAHQMKAFIMLGISGNPQHEFPCFMNTFDVWKYVVPFCLIRSFFCFMYAQMMLLLKCPCVIEGVKFVVDKHYSDKYINCYLKDPVSVRPQTVFPVTASCPLRGAGMRNLSISPLENAFKRFAVYRQPHAVNKGVKSYFHHE